MPGTDASRCDGRAKPAFELGVDRRRIARVDGNDSHLFDYTSALVQVSSRATQPPMSFAEADKRANVVSEPRDRSEPAQRRARARVGESEGRSPHKKCQRANVVSEPRDRSEPAQRRARARVGESEGRSPHKKCQRAN